MIIPQIVKNKIEALRGVLWNFIAGFLFAGQSAIILLFISRSYPIEIAGIITIAYAIANTLMAVGKYGVRNYQVTDIEEVYVFSDYFFQRVVTSMVMLVIGIGYLFILSIQQIYTRDKTIIVLVVIAIRLIEVFDDVFLGRFQQLNQYTKGIRLCAIRQGITTILMCVLFFWGWSVTLTLMVAMAFSCCFEMIVAVYVFRYMNNQLLINIRKIAELTKVCFPLCVGTTLSIFVGNAPKYIIDFYFDESYQAIFGYIMLPVFVMTLFSQFLYQPFVKYIGEAWVDKNKHSFYGQMRKHLISIMGISFVLIVAMRLLGLPILSYLYHIDLAQYNLTYQIMLLGGAIYAVAYYLMIPIIAMRLQNVIAIGFGMVSLIFVLFGGIFSMKYGLVGISILYCITNIGLTLFFGGIVLYRCKNRQEWN